MLGNCLLTAGRGSAATVKQREERLCWSGRVAAAAREDGRAEDDLLIKANRCSEQNIKNKVSLFVKLHFAVLL